MAKISVLKNSLADRTTIIIGSLLCATILLLPVNRAKAMCLDVRITAMRATVARCIDPTLYIIKSAGDHYEKTVKRPAPSMTRDNYLDVARRIAETRRIVGLELSETKTFEIYRLVDSKYQRIEKPRALVSDFPTFGIFYSSSPDRVSCDELLAMPEQFWILSGGCYDTPDPYRFPAMHSFRYVTILNDYKRAELKSLGIDLAD